MELWLESCIAVLAVLVLLLCIRLHLVKKAAREIHAALPEKLNTDTNTPITLSCRDKDLCLLADTLNQSLEQLRAMQHCFEQGNAQLQTAITSISHDLRMPLTAICGHLDLLEREEKSPEVARHLEVIAGRARAMRELTGELFRYSLAEEDVQTLEPERVNLNAALEEAVLSCFGALKERGIEPVIRMPDLPVERMLNRAALLRVLENILSNAIRYGDGDLEIELRGQGEMRISNGARSLDGVQVGRLFDRFYTVETGRGSTGLGLSIARLLIERMGGEIGAEYAAGRLEIWLRFSAAPPENVEIL